MTFDPIYVVKMELSEPLPSFNSSNTFRGIRYGQVQILACLHDHPLGLIEVPFVEDTLQPSMYGPVIWSELAQKINGHLEYDGLPQLNQLPPAGVPGRDEARCEAEKKRLLNDPPLISVVICTHERPDMLIGCLDSVSRLNYPNFEIVIVDNAPKTDATQNLVTTKFQHLSNLRYVIEPNQGQCWARNTGALAAQGSIIAYTDDDVIVDANWLIGVLRGFAAGESVGAVNGLTIPAELETIEQVWFEHSGGFNKGYDRAIFDMQRNKPSRPFYPLSAGIFGTGANLSIKKSALEKVGYFDPALGAGTITTCGDDLAMYVQLLYAGYQLVYEPTACIQHIHRRDFPSLQDQIHNYGVGFAAFLTKTLLDHPEILPGFLLGIPYGVYLLFHPKSFKNTKKTTSYPSKLKRLEYFGMLKGGPAYIISRFRSRRMIRPEASAAPVSPRAPGARGE